MKHLKSLLSPLVVAVLATVPLLPKVVVAATEHSQGQLVDVRILMGEHAAPLYSRGWTLAAPKLYFQAFEGGHYAVQLRNLTNRRVAVLISVDGLNVVSGARSNLRPDEGMYVLGPWESTLIRGWRTSLDEVRQFVFVDEQRSYAARTGQANGDMGWLRVLAFEEQRPVSWGQLKSNGGGGDATNQAPAPANDTRGDRREPAAGAPEGGAKAQAAAPTRELARDEASRESVPGTGWGERREDHVERTVFLAQSTPTDQLIFRYEYASGLRALGIFPRQPRVWQRENGQLGFAQPPRW